MYQTKTHFEPCSCLYIWPDEENGHCSIYWEYTQCTQSHMRRNSHTQPRWHRLYACFPNQAPEFPSSKKLCLANSIFSLQYFQQPRNTHAFVSSLPSIVLHYFCFFQKHSRHWDHIHIYLQYPSKVFSGESLGLLERKLVSLSSCSKLRNLLVVRSGQNFSSLGLISKKQRNRIGRDRLEEFSQLLKIGYRCCGS